MRAKTLMFVLASVFAGQAAAAPEKYTFDPTHSQIRFGYDHLGFSNIWLSFGKFDGELMLDTADLTKSSVSVVIPVDSVYTNVEKFDTHLESGDFFEVAKHPTATFKSTKVEKVDADSLKVTGDLTMNGITKPVVLDVTINKIGEHPMAKDPAAGFDARTTLKRTDFDLGLYAPNVSDEVTVEITAETHKASATPEAAK